MHNRRKTIWMMMGVLVAVFAIGIAQATVFAREAMPTISPASLGRGFGIGFDRGGCGQAALDAAAKALKTTTSDLTAQLWGGRTLADLADKAGVKLTDIQSAVQAACQAALKTAIQQAVTNGTLSQAQADWLIEGLDKGYWGSREGLGFGFGMGRHGIGGFRGFGGFGAPNNSTPNSKGTTSPSRFIF